MMRTPERFESNEAVIAIGMGLCHRTLPKSQWTHAAHFAAAVWLLGRPDIDAVLVLPQWIRAYNEHTGVANTDTGGYHETITLASLRGARSFMASHGGGLADCCNALMVSPLGHPDWLLAYWSRERLFSVAARRSWVEPDLAALPF